jgi:hypothetical protein
MEKLTREDVRKFVERIAAASSDDEAAHGMEDELRECVLKAIASGNCDDPKGCAEEALRTSSMSFARWCA